MVKILHKICSLLQKESHFLILIILIWMPSFQGYANEKSLIKATFSIGEITYNGGPTVPQGYLMTSITHNATENHAIFNATNDAIQFPSNYFYTTISFKYKSSAVGSPRILTLETSDDNTNWTIATPYNLSDVAITNPGSTSLINYSFDLASPKRYVRIRSSYAITGDIHVKDFVLKYNICEATSQTFASVNPVNSVTPATTLTLSNNNIHATYQWEQKLFDDENWTIIPLAINNSYIATPLVSTYYRCRITCNETETYSEPILIFRPSCYASGSTANNTGIVGVQFNEINNLNQTPSNTGYTYYPEHTTTIYRGKHYQLLVNVHNTTGLPLHTSVWFDWNRDGIVQYGLEDIYDEVYDYGIFYDNPQSNQFMNPLSIKVPDYAISGPATMRVITSTLPLVTLPCTIGLFSGEVEDYIIHFNRQNPDITVFGPVIEINNEQDYTSNTNNTRFANTFLGFSSIPHLFTITNAGHDTLQLGNISIIGQDASSFSVSTQPISSELTYLGDFTTFSVQFTPTSVGPKIAYVKIPSNDPNKPDFVFRIEAVGSTECTKPPLKITAIPNTAPALSIIKIKYENFDELSNPSNLKIKDFTVKFGNSTLTALEHGTDYSTYQIPEGIDDSFIRYEYTTNCSANTAFTLTKDIESNCIETVVQMPTDLFISQVADSNTDDISYIEVYNATTQAIDLSQYHIAIHIDGSVLPTHQFNLKHTLLQPNNAFFIALGDPSNFCANILTFFGVLSYQTIPIMGLNFHRLGDYTLGHDAVRLIKNNTTVDQWGEVGNEGWATSINIKENASNFIRNNKGSVPNHGAFQLNQFDLSHFAYNCTTNNYLNIGAHEMKANNAIIPLIHPQDQNISNCPLPQSITLQAQGGFSDNTILETLIYSWFYKNKNADSFITINQPDFLLQANGHLQINNPGSHIGSQFYCEISVAGKSCKTYTKTVSISDGLETTHWIEKDGVKQWSNGNPSITKKVIIDTPYNTTNDVSFSARRLQLNSSLTIAANTYVEVFADIDNKNGQLNILNNGSLIQRCNVENATDNNNFGATENFSMERISKPIFRYDYIYWSTPATFNSNITLHDISPLTLSSKFHSWNTLQNEWTTHNDGQNIMIPGKGYIVRGPSIPATETAPANIYPNTRAPFTATFIGNFNNGWVRIPAIKQLENSWNLIGNPYPSAININDFLQTNGTTTTGVVYIWKHTTPLFAQSDNTFAAYSENDYLAYNLSGLVKTSESTLEDEEFNGYIAAGQGFFVNVNTAGDLVFNNNMRATTNNNQFYRGNTLSEPNENAANNGTHRVWLNLTSGNNHFNQTLVAYIQNATNGIDWGYDAQVLSNTSLTLYSLVENTMLTIQGRALPFNISDTVQLGFRTTLNGQHTIKIDKTDGLLNAQNIYLKDLELSIIHDLKSGPYHFTATPGTNNNRFVLQYTNQTLNSTKYNPTTKQVFAYKNDHNIMVKSMVDNIQMVELFDTLGRKLTNTTANPSLQMEVQVPQLPNQTILLKITLQNGQTVFQKIIW